MVLTASTCFEVFMRYALRAPTAWAFDMSYMLYGALFIMSGAYALSRGSHVRGDFIYRKWAPRTQARLDIVLYVFFYFPGVLAMVFVGGAYGAESMRILEASANSPAGVPVWPLKMLICVAGVTLTLAGIAEVLRCLVCLRTGRWPARGGDVEELDVVLKERHAAEVEK
ncbi:MAG: TRAP transporter small permease subunit [Rubrivivax sp.]|nr:TRAP transporter small permease subunit [Rubrivivax sp.]